MFPEPPSSDSLSVLAQTNTSRRAFLRTAGLSAVSAGALVACGKTASADPANAATGAVASVGTGTAVTPAPVTPATIRAAADAMDAMHEKGIKAFPAKTAGRGNQLLAPKIVNGVKVFELMAREITWEVTPGQMVGAMAYNNQVPGPQIRVREGDRVRVILENELTQSTAIHFHGLELPNAMRYAERRPGRTMGRHCSLQQSGHLGVPLPHSSARGIRTGNVRDGNGPRGLDVR